MIAESRMTQGNSTQSGIAERYVATLLRSRSKEETHRELSELTREMINARKLNWVEEVEGSQSEADSATAVDSEMTESLVEEQELLAKLKRNQQPVIEPSQTDRNVTQIGIRVPGSGSLICHLVASPNSLPSFVALLKMAAGYFVLASDQQQQTQLKSFALDTSVRLGLIEGLFKTPDCDDALKVFCEQVAQFAGASLGMLFLTPKRGKSSRLAAFSGPGQADVHGETMRLARGLANEVMIGGQAVDQEIDNKANCPSRSAAALAAHLGAARVITIAIDDSQGNSRGALLLVGEQFEESRISQLRHAVTSCSAALLFRHRPSLPGTAPHSRRRLRSWSIVLLVLALLTGLMFVPVPYHAHTSVLLSPTTRRIIDAPFEGILLRTDAKSGDLVEAGQVLAAMDDQPLTLELSRLKSEETRVRKQHEIDLAQGEVAKSQLAELRLNELKASIELVQSRLRQSQIVSPISGVIISQDLDDVQHSPVTLGQPLYEVAPLNEIRAEIEVPAHQASELYVGQDVDIWIEDGGSRKRSGKIKRIAPRTQLRNGRNVVLCELLLDNDSAALRPGMEGHAAIDSGQKTIGWVLFHRLWDRGRVYVGI